MIEKTAPAARDVMAQDEEGPPSTTATVLRFFRLFSDLLKPRNVMVLVALTALGISAVFGGWQAAADDATDIPVVATGEVVAAHPFEITVLEAVRAPTLDPLCGIWNPSTCVGLRIEVALTVPEPVPSYVLGHALHATFPGITLTPEPGLWSNASNPDGSLGRPTIYRAIDQNLSRSLQPNLTQEYVVIWELPETTPAAASLELAYQSQTWRASALDGGYQWFDPTLVAHQDIPLTLAKVEP